MNNMPFLRSKIEIIPSERGKTYLVKETFTVHTKFGDVTVPKGFKHDRFSVVPDLPNSEIAAIVHDWLYRTKKFDDGRVCEKWQVDIIFRDLIWNSKDWMWAPLYYAGIVLLGWPAWLKPRKL